VIYFAKLAALRFCQENLKISTYTGSIFTGFASLIPSCLFPQRATLFFSK